MLIPLVPYDTFVCPLRELDQNTLVPSEGPLSLYINFDRHTPCYLRGPSPLLNTFPELRSFSNPVAQVVPTFLFSFWFISHYQTTLSGTNLGYPGVPVGNFPRFFHFTKLKFKILSNGRHPSYLPVTAPPLVTSRSWDFVTTEIHPTNLISTLFNHLCSI